MNGLSSKNSTALTSSSIRAVISAMSALSAKCMRAQDFSRLKSPHSTFGRDAMLRLLLIGGSLLIAPLAAQAQATYSCTGNDGKKYYGPTIPMQCVGRPVEQLNSQGLVVRRIEPEGEEKARLQKEAAAEKKKEEEATSREETRRSRALLATYTSERDIEEARKRALEDNEKAVQEVEGKIEALKKRRAGYDKEMEFYKDGKSKGNAPAKLTNDIKNAEIDLKAQEDLLAVKKKEVTSINAKYDQDKKRYLEAT